MREEESYLLNLPGAQVSTLTGARKAVTCALKGTVHPNMFPPTCSAVYLSCWVLEISAVEISNTMELDATQLEVLKAPQKNAFEKHDSLCQEIMARFTQDNPQTLQWAVFICSLSNKRRTPSHSTVMLDSRCWILRRGFWMKTVQRCSVQLFCWVKCLRTNLNRVFFFLFVRPISLGRLTAINLRKAAQHNDKMGGNMLLWRARETG